MNSYYNNIPDYMPDKNKLLKKNAKKAVNTVALSVIISTAVTYVLVIITAFATPILQKLLVSALMNINGDSFSHAKAVANSFFLSNEFSWFSSVVMSLVCSFLPYAVMSKTLFGMPLHKAAPMEGKILWSFPILYCAITMLARTASMAVNGIFSFILPDAYGKSPADTVAIYGESSGAASLILCFLAMCIVAPFIEEFIYRGIIFGHLRKFGFVFAAFSSSLFFGLAHATVEQIAHTFVSGLVFCLIAEKTKNLKTGILIHFLNNFIAYVQAYILPLAGSDRVIEIFDTVYVILYGIFSVAGIIILFVHKEKKDDDGNNGKTHDEYEENAPVSCFFCVGSIFVILFSVFNLVLGML